MEKDNLIKALESLESKYCRKEGYNTIEILEELNIPYSYENGYKLRKRLRSMIDGKLYPEFKTAGTYDIVYCPNGKKSGQYRLSKYRDWKNEQTI